MPNLMYMTSFENKAARDEHWKTFGSDPEWKKLKQKNPAMWKDAGLKEAGRQFAALAQAQRDHFIDKKTGKRSNFDFAGKDCDLSLGPNVQPRSNVMRYFFIAPAAGLLCKCTCFAHAHHQPRAQKLKQIATVDCEDMP